MGFDDTERPRSGFKSQFTIQNSQTAAASEFLALVTKLQIDKFTMGTEGGGRASGTAIAIHNTRP